MQQTIIGIIICLFVIICFIIGFAKSSYLEGLTNNITDEITKPITTTFTNDSSLDDEITALENSLSISTKKNTYIDAIHNLIDYYDYKSLQYIVNITPNSKGEYNIPTEYIHLKKIKDALNDTLLFVKSQ